MQWFSNHRTRVKRPRSPGGAHRQDSEPRSSVCGDRGAVPRAEPTVGVLSVVQIARLPRTAAQPQGGNNQHFVRIRKTTKSTRLYVTTLKIMMVHARKAWTECQARFRMLINRKITLVRRTGRPSRAHVRLEPRAGTLFGNLAFADVMSYDEAARG